MIQIRMMKEEDRQSVQGDATLAPLLAAEHWGEPYCIIAEENGKIVGGLSGSIQGHEAALQACLTGDVQAVTAAVLTEGLIRSILYVLDKRGVAMAYLASEVEDTVRQKIGFASAGEAGLPDWIQGDRQAMWSADIKEFLARDCCGCKGN